MEKGLYIIPWSHTCIFETRYTTDMNVKVRNMSGVKVHTFSDNFIFLDLSKIQSHFRFSQYLY